MTKYLLTLLLTLFLGLASLGPTPLSAQEAANPFAGMSPEVFSALQAINMDKEQKPKFGAAMMTFAADMQSMTKRVMRSRKTDKPRIIKRKAKGLSKKLDASMKEFLRDEQWPAYLHYKQLAQSAAQ